MPGRPGPRAVRVRAGDVHGDVAPSVRHCAACHQPDGPGPFSVLTYEEVRRRATQIAAVTQAGVMPPRKAEPGHGDFVGQDRLSPTDVATIRRWAEAGAVEGSLGDLPPMPAKSGGWQLGVPDLIVRLCADDGRHRRLPHLRDPAGRRRRFVRGSVPPGNRVVHHATSASIARRRRGGSTRIAQATAASSPTRPDIPTVTSSAGLPAGGATLAEGPRLDAATRIGSRRGAAHAAERET
jgi:hypothetical protein